MSTQHVRPPAVLAGLAALLAGCATGYSAERGQKLEERVDQIEAQGGSLPTSDADRSAMREQARRMDERISALEAKLSQQGKPGQQDAQAAEELATLRRQLEEQKKLLDEQARRLDAMDTKVASLGRPSKPAAPQKGTAKAPSAPPAAAPSSPAASAGAAAAGGAVVGGAAGAGAAVPRASASTGTGAAGGGGRAEVLALAKEQESQGKRDAARDLYQEYVQRFPSDPGSAEARYRLGEMDFADKRYKDAIVQFGKVARDFGGSDLAPDALLRTADSMAAIGMNEDAKAVLQDVPRRYPNSAAAARAKEKLAKLGGATKP